VVVPPSRPAPAVLPGAKCRSGPAAPHTENRRTSSPRRLAGLFLAFAAYTAAPMLTVPILGLSWSALLFFLIAFEVFGRLRGRRFSRTRLWNGLATTLWLGTVASFVANAPFARGDDLIVGSAVSVFQFAYWMLVFVTSAHVIRIAQLGPRLPYYLGTAVTVLAVVVLLERLVLGTISTDTGSSSITRLTQNGYGWEFSTFSAFLLVPATSARGRPRWLALVGLLLVWSAAAVNGSRSSWGAVAISLGVFLFLQIIATRSARNVGVLILILASGAAVAWLAPAAVKERVGARASTVERLETDKSFQIRILLIQKARRLFAEHPIFGVGPDQFTHSTPDLDIPPVLRYAGDWWFNQKSAHNSYLLLLAEGGLVCVVPFVFLLLVLLARGAPAAIVLCQHNEPWALAAYAGFVGMSVHLWSMVGLTNTAPWLVYGIVAAAVDTARDRRNPRSRTR
jgi:O-antigen ligase